MDFKNIHKNKDNRNKIRCLNSGLMLASAKDSEPVGCFLFVEKGDQHIGERLYVPSHEPAVSLT